MDGWMDGGRESAHCCRGMLKPDFDEQAADEKAAWARAGRAACAGDWLPSNGGRVTEVT